MNHESDLIMTDLQSLQRTRAPGPAAGRRARGATRRPGGAGAAGRTVLSTAVTAAAAAGCRAAAQDGAKSSVVRRLSRTQPGWLS